MMTFAITSKGDVACFALVGWETFVACTFETLFSIGSCRRFSGIERRAKNPARRPYRHVWITR